MEVWGRVNQTNGELQILVSFIKLWIKSSFSLMIKLECPETLNLQTRCSNAAGTQKPLLPEILNTHTHTH